LIKESKGCGLFQGIATFPTYMINLCLFLRTRVVGSTIPQRTWEYRGGYWTVNNTKDASINLPDLASSSNREIR
jgi:hypothetical protein